MSAHTRDPFVDKVARLVEAGGETDEDVLIQHAGHLLLQEAEAALAAGQSLLHRAAAAAKILKALRIMVIVTGAGAACQALHASALRACAKPPRAAGAAQRETAELVVAAGVACVLNPAVLGASERRNMYAQLKELAAQFRSPNAAATGAHLRQLGIDVDLTAADIEAVCLGKMIQFSFPGDAGFVHRLTTATRYAELTPGPRGFVKVANAAMEAACDSAREAGGIRVGHIAAMEGLHALTQGEGQGSAMAKLHLSARAVQSIRAGALGRTWEWGQLAPHVAGYREAAARLKRWMVPVMWESQVKDVLQEYASLEGAANRPQASVAAEPTWWDEGPAPPQQRQCACCGAKQGTMHMCGACKKAFYCGPACQKKHWKAHKKGCKPAEAEVGSFRAPL